MKKYVCHSLPQVSMRIIGNTSSDRNSILSIVREAKNMFRTFSCILYKMSLCQFPRGCYLCIFSMVIYLLEYAALKWIPWLLDPALVGSVATTSGLSEIGVVGRERESEKGRRREVAGGCSYDCVSVGKCCRSGNGGANGLGTEGGRG